MNTPAPTRRALTSAILRRTAGSTTAVATALSLVLLTACASDTDSDPLDENSNAPATTEPEPEPTEAATTPPSPSETTSPSAEEEAPEEEPTEEAPQEDPANPDPLPDVTEPGTQLALGETITVRQNVGVLDEDEAWAVMRYSVTSIEPGDDALIDDLSNAEEYDGGSVVYVRGTVEVVALFGAGIGGIVGGAVTGVQDDGYLTGGIFSVPEATEDCTGNFLVSRASVGDVEESCTVALALPGTEVVAAAYYSDTVISSDGPSEDPYLADPVVWLP